MPMLLLLLCCSGALVQQKDFQLIETPPLAKIVNNGSNGETGGGEGSLLNLNNKGESKNVPAGTFYPWVSKCLSHGAEGDEGLYLPNNKSNLVIALDALSLLFCIFINTTAYYWGDASLHLPLAVALITLV